MEPVVHKVTRSPRHQRGRLTPEATGLSSSSQALERRPRPESRSGGPEMAWFCQLSMTSPIFTNPHLCKLSTFFVGSPSPNSQTRSLKFGFKLPRQSLHLHHAPKPKCCRLFQHLVQCVSNDTPVLCNASHHTKHTLVRAFRSVTARVFALPAITAFHCKNPTSLLCQVVIMPSAFF